MITRLLASGLVAAALVVGLQTWRLANERQAHSATQLTLAEERGRFALAMSEASDAFAQMSEEYRQREQTLQAAADQARRERDAQVAAARRNADALRERLFHAPEAPGVDYTLGGNTTPAASPRAFAPGSFGALVRGEAADVAGNLVDEAERAETIRLELMRVYQLYDEARQALAAGR